MNNRFCSLKNFIDFLPCCSLKKLWKMFNKLTNIHIFNKNAYFLIKLLILFVFFNKFLYLYTFFAYFYIFVSQYNEILQIAVILLILMHFYTILGSFKHFSQPNVYIRYVVWKTFNNIFNVKSSYTLFWVLLHYFTLKRTCVHVKLRLYTLVLFVYLTAPWKFYLLF